MFGLTVLRRTFRCLIRSTRIAELEMEPNHALRQARERRPSSRVPGCPTSRDELAVLVNNWLLHETGEVFALDERAIGRWERGAVRRPSEHYRAALRAVLEVDHDWELGFQDRPPEPLLMPGSADALPPTVDAIRAVARSLHIVDRRCGGGSLYSSVTAYLQAEVARALFAPHSGAHVFAAAASLTEIAGWMAHDSGRDVDARAHFDGAYRLALAAGSAALAANMCASMSHLASQLGLMHDAMRLADVGLQRLSQAGGVAQVEARLHAMRARALAQSADRDGCLDELARAERALGGRNDDEHATWAAHFDGGSLAAEVATALHLLGDLDGAQRHVRQLLELRGGDRVRSLAFGRLSLASVLLDAGQSDEAAILGRQVAQIVPTLSSARVRSRLGELALAIRGRPETAVTRSFLAEMADLAGGKTPEAVSAWPV
ncbi:hypothetical protein [Pseudonocardia sp. MH-G8]|uniref:hypothetical protein n=1 Tax=Pseudonocardia sp. MH-G8 TaxID=1854588 RepID=UPI001E5B762B|nr:hypothetical protein [Pseudonocardia sp. MH-G8]